MGPGVQLVVRRVGRVRIVFMYGDADVFISRPRPAASVQLALVLVPRTHVSSMSKTPPSVPGIRDDGAKVRFANMRPSICTESTNVPHPLTRPLSALLLHHQVVGDVHRKPAACGGTKLDCVRPACKWIEEQPVAVRDYRIGIAWH